MATDNSDLLKDIVELLGGGFIGSMARDLVGWFRGAKKDSAEAIATLKDADTRQFQAVKDAQNDRISDLMSEVHKLRDEVVSLRQAYDTQQRHHFEQMHALQKAHAEQMAALREELEEARQTRGIGV